MRNTKFKIGFRTSGFKKRNIFDALYGIKSFGYDGVELCLSHPDLDPAVLDAEKIGKIRRFMQDIGLEIASVSYHGKCDAREEKLGKTLAGIEICGQFGCPVFIMSSQNRESARFDRQFSEFIPFMQEMCAAAARRNISIAIEPEPGTIIRGAAEMGMLINEVRSECLKVNLDIGHSFLTDNDICETIRTFSDAIVHVHIHDIKGTVHEHLIIGRGDIEFRPVLSTLKEIAYRGFLTIDLFNIMHDPEGTAQEAIQELLGMFCSTRRRRRRNVPRAFQEKFN